MKLVPESLNEVNFERSGDIKQQMDLGRRITIELEAHNLVTPEDSKGNPYFDLSDEDTKYFYDNATSRGVKITINGYVKGPGNFELPNIKMSGTKEQLIPALQSWDAHGRDLEEFEEAMEPWNPSRADLDDSTLADIMF